MFSPNKKLINFFRGILVILLVINFINGAVSSNPQFSSTSSWGTFWLGLFLTVLISWLGLEILNFFSRKTKLGHLPAYFWGITAGLNANDFLNDYVGLFEIPNFDKFAHLVGGFFFALIILGLIKRVNAAYGLKPPKWMVYYLVIATVTVGGVIYEIAELIGDKYFGAHNIVGPLDTTGDIMLNTVGAVLLLVIAYVFDRMNKKEPAYEKSA